MASSVTYDVLGGISSFTTIILGIVYTVVLLMSFDYLSYRLKGLLLFIVWFMVIMGIVLVWLPK